MSSRKNKHGLPVMQPSKSFRPEIDEEELIPRKSVRLAVWNKTHGRCFFCGVNLLSFHSMTVDHFIPRSSTDRSRHKGIGDVTLETIGNLVPACSKCNREKANMHPSEYRKKLGRPFYGDK